MAATKEYATSIETRERIVDTCRRLFCEKGYKKTTYAEICRIANVHPGTITYHFENKKNLATLLFKETLDDLHQAVENLWPGEDKLQRKLIANGMHYKLIFDDSSYRRFSMEYSADSFATFDSEQYIQLNYKAYELTRNYVDELRAKFLFMAFAGMDIYLDRYISDNFDDLEYEQVFVYISEIYHPYLDRTELHARIVKAIAYLDTVDVRFDNFRAFAKIRKIPPE